MQRSGGGSLKSKKGVSNAKKFEPGFKRRSSTSVSSLKIKRPPKVSVEAKEESKSKSFEESPDGAKSHISIEEEKETDIREESNVNQQPTLSLTEENGAEGQVQGMSIGKPQLGFLWSRDSLGFKRLRGNSS